MSDDGTFALNNPVYYVGTRPQPQDSPAFLSAFSDFLNAAIAEATHNGGSLLTKTLNLTAEIGAPGQILATTVQISIETDGNTIKVGDSTYPVQQAVATGFSSIVTSVFALGAVAVGATPEGWLAVGVVGGADYLYSKFLSGPVDQLIQQVSNTVDVDFQLMDSSGHLEGGVWYRHGLQDSQTVVLANAIDDLLAKSGTGDLALAAPGMEIKYIYGGTQTEIFKIYSGSIISDTASFFGYMPQQFLENQASAPALWLSSSNELPFNLYFSSGEHSWVYARDIDKLGIDLDQDSLTPRTYFSPADILTGSTAETGTDHDNLIIGTTGNDVQRGGGGNDYIYGGLGNDVIVGGSGNSHIFGGSWDNSVYGTAADGHDTFVIMLSAPGTTQTAPAVTAVENVDAHGNLNNVTLNASGITDTLYSIETVVANAYNTANTIDARQVPVSSVAIQMSANQIGELEYQYEQALGVQAGFIHNNSVFTVYQGPIIGDAIPSITYVNFGTFEATNNYTVKLSSLSGTNFILNGSDDTVDYSSLSSNGLHIALNATGGTVSSLDSGLESGLAFSATALNDLEPAAGSNSAASVQDIFTGAETVIGSTQNDVFTAGSVSGRTLDGGSGFNTVDYSQDTSGLTVTQSGNDFLVSDGAGHTDTLTNIQHIILTNATDTLTLNAPTQDGARIIDGGGGSDTVHYNNTVTLFDMNTDRVYGGTGDIAVDVLQNIETYDFHAQSIRPDYQHDYAFKVNEADGYDYSMAKGPATIHVDLQTSIFPSNYFDPSVIADLSHSVSMDVTLNSPGSGTVFQSGTVETQSIDGHIRDIEGGIRLFNLVGTNYGDTVTISTNDSTPYQRLIYHSGIGDDTVTLDPSIESFSSHYAGSVTDGAPTAIDARGVQYYYDGGHDIVYNGAALGEVHINSDVTGVSEIVNDFEASPGIETKTFAITLSMADGGSLTLDGFSGTHIFSSTYDPGYQIRGVSSIQFSGSTSYGYVDFDAEGNPIVHSGALPAPAISDITNPEPGYDHHITGTAANETLYGSTGNDIIEGGGGTDTLYGGDGNDLMLGGDASGASTLYGGAGDDTYSISSAGDNLIHDFNGLNNLIVTDSIGANVYAQFGSDGQLILSTGGIDSFASVDGYQSFSGITFSDGATMSMADVITNANDGHALGDFYQTTSGDDDIDAYDAVSSVVIDLGGGNDVFSGSEYADTVYGGEGDDTLFGRGGSDALHGGTGNDFLVGGPGNDILDGTGGYTEAAYYDSPAAITVDLTAGTAQDGWGTTDTLINIRSVDGTSFDDRITGSTGDEFFAGEFGNDVIIGGGGNDTFDGGRGDDTLIGGTGDDWYTFQAGDGFGDTVQDTGGFDTLRIYGGLTMADVSFARIGDDLKVTYDDAVTVKNFFSGNSSDVVEQMVFDDGSKFDLTTLLTTMEAGNRAPVANADDFTITKGATLTGNVLADNGHGADSDPDSNALNVIAQTVQTAHGGTAVFLPQAIFHITITLAISVLILSITHFRIVREAMPLVQ